MEKWYTVLTKKSFEPWQMTITYFKRFRMQIDLSQRPEYQIPESDNYRFLPWHEDLIGEHARAKYESFCDELDSHIFPCLGNFDGCLKLMNEISGRRGFVPEATWLVVFDDPFNAVRQSCGTVQGICEQAGTGAIQNLGIIPGHRGSGMGTALLKHSLNGFRNAGVSTVALEVTAHNEGALGLYQRLGFQTSKIVYKSVDVPYQN